MDRWDEGDGYEGFMGRWSRLAATAAVRRIAAPAGLRWLDVGCGTGALTAAILELADPADVVGVDPSSVFVEAARARLGGQADIRVAGGESLPFDDAFFEVVVSGLVLNFIPDPHAAVREWKRVTRPGGTISAYVWDYSEGMGFLRHFWDAAVALDPAARDLDEGVRFRICEPDRLREVFEQAGLRAVESGDIVVTTPFSSFEDYWIPFLHGQGPAPGYVAALVETDRDGLRQRLDADLPRSSDGTIDLIARAWTVTATR
jgi:ubiquinone/menaquinone biosynthesis C-methylase UbiE